MAKYREHTFGKGMICHCGSCETVTMRAVQIVGKMTLDKECSQYAVALGVAISAAASIMMRENAASVLEKSKLPGFLVEIAAHEQTFGICEDISNTIRDWIDKPSNYDAMVEKLNEFITKANEQHEAEQNLPKGD